MCLYQLDQKLEVPEPTIRRGFKVFKIVSEKIYASDFSKDGIRLPTNLYHPVTHNCQYEMDKWYHANTTVLISPTLSSNHGTYISGFHILETILDGKLYYDQFSPSNRYRLFEVEYYDVTAVGRELIYHLGRDVCRPDARTSIANHMKICSSVNLH